MNCSACRLHLSDYLENAVTPRLRRDLLQHLEACDGCARDLRELEIVLERLRAAPSVAAPPDLAARVTQRLLAVSPNTVGATTGGQAATSRSRDGNRREANRRAASARERNRAWQWAAVAAAGLMIAAVSFLTGRIAGRPGADALADLESARTEVRSLESELRDTRAELSAENATLRHELLSLKSGLERWKTAAAEHRSALEAERGAQHALEERLQEAARRIEAQARMLASVQSGLARAIEQSEGAIRERDALAVELRAARTELERVHQLEVARERRVERSGGRSGIPSSRLRSPNESPDDAHPSQDPAPITFVREGEVLRLELRGPFEELVPRLLSLAEDERQPEIADLALVTLETRLEPLARGGAEEALGSPPEEGGIAGWFRRRVAAVRLATFAESEEPDVHVSDRRARVDRVRRIWQYTQSL